jgi:hypothetical protein
MAPGRGSGGGRADRHGDREFGIEHRRAEHQRPQLHAATSKRVRDTELGCYEDHLGSFLDVKFDHVDAAVVDDFDFHEYGRAGRGPRRGPIGADAVAGELDEYGVHGCRRSMEDRLGVSVRSRAPGVVGTSVPGLCFSRRWTSNRQRCGQRDSRIG